MCHEDANKRQDSKHEPNSLISQSSKVLAHGLDRQLVKIWQQDGSTMKEA